MTLLFASQWDEAANLTGTPTSSRGYEAEWSPRSPPCVAPSVRDSGLDPDPYDGPMYELVVYSTCSAPSPSCRARRLDGRQLPAPRRARSGRQAALLELSGLGIGLMYIGLIVLLRRGIVAGFMGRPLGARLDLGRARHRWSW